jgi:hypothetical protein
MNNRRPRFANARRGRNVAVRPVPVTDQLEAIRQKFQRLRALDEQIGQIHPLYEERNRLMEELLPAFVTITPTQVITQRQITIGTNVYRINPYFLDTRRNIIKGKVWKSACFETFTIE